MLCDTQSTAHSYSISKAVELWRHTHTFKCSSDSNRLDHPLWVSLANPLWEVITLLFHPDRWVWLRQWPQSLPGSMGGSSQLSLVSYWSSRVEVSRSCPGEPSFGSTEINGVCQNTRVGTLLSSVACFWTHTGSTFVPGQGTKCCGSSEVTEKPK